MRDYHGIIFAYSAAPALRDLVSERTSASLPFCGRYRVIDFALSSLRNAGILDVGVIMQRDYQSLLNHLGSGKSWDMSRRVGGLRMLPPFGLPENHTGNYSGTIEALNAVATYIRDIPQKHIILLVGSICANIDLDAAIRLHQSSGSPVTAICTDRVLDGSHHRYVIDENGKVEKILLDREGPCEGVTSLGGYIIHKDVLLDYMDRCKADNLYLFHRDGVSLYLKDGGMMNAYIHKGYASAMLDVDSYYRANMDMLSAENRSSVFPMDRPVRTKNHEEVSTYYGEKAVSKNSLVADNCIIEGELENCIVFSGARIGQGAKLRNCIIMRGCVIGAGAKLDCVIADKYSSFSPGIILTGSPKLPMVVPKHSQI